ncbi:hypothetical protein ACSFA3_09120 [Variovorax sp. RHLX14]|uniref:hypothetical protein n=1 Tax=Variovorax sp. RHLX14 TaxID=1259731 RepID=UPI003F48CE21
MIIYATGEKWLALKKTEARHIERFPVLNSPATVVWQPSNSAVGIASFEGDARHAAVLVERRLRTEGTIEAETKIFIHHVERVSRTYQALYSSASLDEWHRMQGWASAQPGHCAWTTLCALAWSRVDAQTAVVLHVDNAFVFMGRTGLRIVQANTLAFGIDEDSVAYATRALGDRIRAQWSPTAAGAAAALPTVEWISASETCSAENYAGMMRAFADASGLQVVSTDALLALAVDDGSEAAVETMTRTALPRIASRPPIGLLLNTQRERVLLAAERHRTTAMAAALLVTCVFLGFAVQKSLELRRIAAANQALQQRIAAANRPEPTPADDTGDAAYREQLTFIETVARLQAGLDVNEVLMALKSAAGADIRILSVRAEEPTPERETQPRGILVDGVIQDTRSNQDSATLSSFVRSLAVLGYTAEPFESRAAAAASAVSSQLFTYRLIHKEERARSGTKP